MKNTMEQGKLFSIQEYLSLEIEALERNEYRNGKIVEMESSTFVHSVLGASILHLLDSKTTNAENDCWILNSQIKIFVEQYNHFVYPSGVITTEEPKIHNYTDHAIINPTMVVEVLSDTSEAYDRGRKFHLYQSIPSLQEYILIDQNKPLVDTFHRADVPYWNMQTTIGLDQSFRVHTLGIDLKMADLYKKVSDLKFQS